MIARLAKIWQVISDYGIKPSMSFDEQKSIRILNQFSVVGIIIAIYYTLLLLALSGPELVIYDLNIGILGVCVIVMTKKFGYKTGGVFMLLTIPIPLVLLNYVYGNVGGHYYYFSLFILSFYIFGKNWKLALLGLYLIVFFGISLYFEKTVVPTENADALAPFFLYTNITFTFFIGFLFLRLFVLEHERNQIEITRQNKLLEVTIFEAGKKNSEIQMLLKELSHRTKNNLQLISSILNIQSYKVTDEKARQALEEGRNRIVSILILHQKLYSDKNLTGVKVKDYIIDLVNHLKSAFVSENEIKIDIEADELFIKIDFATSLGLILNEILTNSFKYGIKTSGEKFISVSTHKTESEKIVVVVKDSGTGIEGLYSDNQKSESGFGKELIFTLVKQMEGDIIIAENNENSVKIVIPASKHILSQN